MKKKLLILFVIVAMILSLAVFAACEPKNKNQNQNTPPADDNINSGEIDSGNQEEEPPKDEDVYITDGNGSITELSRLADDLTSFIVPSKIGDENITGINDSVFINRKNLKSVKISSGIESIGNYVFENCSNLTEVEIPDTVTRMGERVFNDCVSLKEITLPKSITSIQEMAFANCQSLKKVELPQDLEMIFDYAFASCESLESITFPTDLTYLGRCAFQGCGLKSVEIPDNILSIGENLFNGCYSLETVQLPENMSSISEDMFRGCKKLNGVLIPATVSRIESGAFYGCSLLTQIEIPASVKNIGSSAFGSCIKLESVTFENNASITSIGDYAFENCQSLQEIVIPNTLSNIGGRAFEFCNKLAIYTQRASESKGWQFGWNGNRPVVLGAKANGITDDGVKWGLVEGDIIVISGLRDDVNNVELPATIDGNSVQKICGKAFYDLENLTDLIVPDSITSVDSYIVNSIDKKLVIYSKSADAQAWADSYSGVVAWNYKSHGVTDNIRWGLNQSNEITVVGYNGEVVNLNVPATLNGNAVKAISNSAFYKRSNMETITLPDGLKSIGNLAFEQCYSISKVELPNSLETIGANAFASCTGIIELELGDSIDNIGIKAFYGCIKLAQVTIAQSVSKIGGYAFGECESAVIYCQAASIPSEWDSNWSKGCKAVVWDCDNNDSASNGKIYYTFDDFVRYELKGVYATVSALTKPISGELVIPSSVTYKDKVYQVAEIGEKAFSNGRNLTKIELPDSITKIGSEAFSKCENLQYNQYDNALYLGSSSNPYMALVKAKDKDVTSCQINANTKMIVCQAFEYKKLTEIEIPSGVDIIGKKAFAGCSNLTSVKISNGVTRIEDFAFDNCTNLSSIKIPASVNYIGYRVFINCNGLSIECQAVSQSSSWNRDWNVGDRPVTWGVDNITDDENFDYVVDNNKVYLTRFKGTSLQVVVPETIDGKQVEDIGEIFRESNIRSVELPSGISAICDYAFYKCSDLTSVAMPQQGVVSIGEFAFASCSRLYSIELSSTLKSIGELAFDSCNALRSIYIPNSVEFIGAKAFYFCNSLTINCQAASKPATWDDDWNLKSISSDIPVVWDYVKE